MNADGGVNGRKINFITYDDAYSPAKAVEQVRRLVESDGVLAVFNPLGNPSNTAIQKYLNDRKTPQLFVATGTTEMGRLPQVPLDDQRPAALPGRGDGLCAHDPGAYARPRRLACCTRTMISARTMCWG